MVCLYCFYIFSFNHPVWFQLFFPLPHFCFRKHFFSPRLAAAYLHRVPAKHQVIIFEDEPEFLFTSYIFYNHLFNSQTSKKVQKAYKTKNFQLQNVQINRCVPQNLVFQPNTTYIIDENVGFCHQNTINTTPAKYFSQKKPSVYIKSVKDSGNNYAIYNDIVCHNHQKLATFIYPQTVGDFNFGKLNNASFCRIWITRPL